jgi:hypothetical protein
MMRRHPKAFAVCACCAVAALVASGAGWAAATAATGPTPASGIHAQAGKVLLGNGSWTLDSHPEEDAPTGSPSPQSSSSPVPSSSPTSDAPPPPEASPTPEPSSSVTSEPPTCYQTVVTEHAGPQNSNPELYTDTVTFSWCEAADGQVQILSSSQVPAVEASGFSYTGAEIKLMNALGVTFVVTPATAPTPAIHNQPTYASTVASGLSFGTQFNLGSALADLFATYITDGLAARLTPLIRSGQLGRALLREWGTVVAKFDALAANNFGLPNWAANYVADLPISTIKDEVAHLGQQFVTTLTQSLEALGRNPTTASVTNAVESGIAKIASALNYPTVDWAPQIIIEVDSSLDPFVNNGNTQAAFGILVEEPTITTTTSS